MADEAEPQDPNTVKRKRSHDRLMVIAGIVAPLLAGGGTYYQTSGGVETELAKARLEASQSYASKADVQAMAATLVALSNQLAEIRGVLRGRRIYESRRPAEETEPSARAAALPREAGDGG